MVSPGGDGALVGRSIASRLKHFPCQLRDFLLEKSS
jgi:hypothetical protein